MEKTWQSLGNTWLVFLISNYLGALLKLSSFIQFWEKVESMLGVNHLLPGGLFWFQCVWWMNPYLSALRKINASIFGTADQYNLWVGLAKRFFKAVAKFDPVILLSLAGFLWNMSGRNDKQFPMQMAMVASPGCCPQTWCECWFINSMNTSSLYLP